MTLLDNELARRDGMGGPAGAKLQLRPHPVRVRWAFADLATADGHDLRCTFTASVRALPDPIEQRTLAEVLLGGKTSLRADDVSTHFAPTLRAAAAATAKAKGIDVWMAPDDRGELVDAFKQAAAKVAFACGLEVLAPYDLEVESRSYQQQKLLEMERALAEKKAAGQVEQLNRAGDLLKKFQEIRTAAPELSAGQIMERISPSDRGPMLQSLLLASAKSEAAQDLWAVAGPYLVKIDARAAMSPGGGLPRTELTPLPPTIGPTRSVQPAQVDGERVLLVGCRAGFLVVRPNARPGEEPQIYADPAVESQYGFSRIVYAGREHGYVACHGEAGIVRWSPGRPGGPVATFRPDRFAAAGPGEYRVAASPDDSIAGSIVGSRAPGPRNLQVLDEHRLIFSVGNRVWVMNLAGGPDFAQLPAESGAEVIALVPTERQIVAVHEDGTICGLDRSTAQVSCRERRADRLRAAGPMPWLGGTRLLLAGEEGPVECVAVDDPLVTQYASPHRGLRVVTGSTDLVVGVSADRQRLILWPTWDGRHPAAEVYLTAQTRHRVADVEVG